MLVWLDKLSAATMPIPVIAAVQGILAANGLARRLVNNKYLESACGDSGICRSLADTPLTPWYFTPAVYYGTKLYNAVTGNGNSTNVKSPVIPPSSPLPVSATSSVGPQRRAVSKSSVRFAPY